MKERRPENIKPSDMIQVGQEIVGNVGKTIMQGTLNKGVNVEIPSLGYVLLPDGTVVDKNSGL